MFQEVCQVEIHWGTSHCRMQMVYQGREQGLVDTLTCIDHLKIKFMRKIRLLQIFYMYAYNKKYMLH